MLRDGILLEDIEREDILRDVSKKLDSFKQEQIRHELIKQGIFSYHEMVFVNLVISFGIHQYRDLLPEISFLFPGRIHERIVFRDYLSNYEIIIVNGFL